MFQFSAFCVRPTDCVFSVQLPTDTYHRYVLLLCAIRTIAWLYHHLSSVCLRCVICSLLSYCMLYLFGFL